MITQEIRDNAYFEMTGRCPKCNGDVLIRRYFEDNIYFVTKCFSVKYIKHHRTQCTWDSVISFDKFAQPIPIIKINLNKKKWEEMRIRMKQRWKKIEGC